MPASLVYHQHYSFLCTRSDRCRELGQYYVPYVQVHAWKHQPERCAALRTHKAIQIRPFVAMLDRDNRALPFLAPDPPQDWFEADPMLILSPQLDRGVRMLGSDALERLRKGFF